jgi:uncharacterized protein YqcC (DUF446 family)
VTYSHPFFDLNAIRITCGNPYLQKLFDQIVKANPSHAVRLLNAKTLSFPTFYVLIPQILEHNLERSLLPQNQFALQFATQKNFTCDAVSNKQYLKWMLLSSVNQELDSDAFQAVIDRVAIQLIVVLKDASFLSIIVDVIFRRNRKNHCIYDLCWAINQANTVRVMPLIANYLKSNHEEDNTLAYKLLNFKPELQPKSRTQQYHNFCKWFHENKQFLYLHNETMQETCQPKYWRVNLPAKYLCKDQFAEESLNDLEKEKLKTFQSLRREEQKRLSKYSYRTYQKDKKVWQNWMQSSIHTQFEHVDARGDKL